MPDRTTYIFYAIILGFLAMTGPIAVDVFLPAIPSVANDFGVNIGSVELSLTAVFVGNGLGQIVYGPLSDRFGRKPVILSTLLIYLITTIGSGLANNIETLIFWRFMQGLMMASGRILANAVARDLYNREKLTKLITIIMFVSIFSSIGSAPLGGYLSEQYSWQTVFLFMTVYSIITLTIFAFFFKETISEKNFKAINTTTLIKNFSLIISNRKFFLHVICGGFVLGGIVAYLNSSSGILINGFGIKPTVYGLLFSIVMISQASSALMAEKLIDLVSSKRLMLMGSCAVALAGIIMLILAIEKIKHPAAVIGPMILYVLGFAILWPQTVSACLQPFPHNAGAASSLQGFIQNSMAAIVAAFLSLYSETSAMTMSIGIVICGILTSLTCVLATNLSTSK